MSVSSNGPDDGKPGRSGGSGGSGGTVVLASHNKKKVGELERILGPLVPDVRVRTLDDFPAYDEPVESEPTFAGNALLKARFAVERLGVLAVGDDSGLCVDALNGMPGVLSARWSGQPKDDGRNLRLLLDQLADVPDGRRGAAFVCTLAVVRPDGTECVVEGRAPGRMIREARGAGGFGYDPIFVPDGETRTYAELPDGEKDVVSHRGRALRALAPVLSDLLRA